MSVIVGGGSGFVGSALVQSLLSNGYKPVIVGRVIKACIPGAKFITWDELKSTGTLPPDCKAVINLAGANILDPWKRFPAYKEEVYESRIQTTKLLANLIDSCQQKPGVWISASAIGYYDTKPTIEYDETSPSGNPNDFVVKLCIDWEAAAKLSDHKTRHAIIRNGIVLGRTGGMIQRLFVPFYLGMGGPVGTGAQWLSWIHLRDVIGLILHIIENKEASGVFNATSPNPCTYAEFAHQFGKALWRPAYIPTPGFVMTCMFGAERAKMILEGGKIYPKRAIQSGYRFLYEDIDDACEEFARVSYSDEEMARTTPPTSSKANSSSGK